MKKALTIVLSLTVLVAAAEATSVKQNTAADLVRASAIKFRVPVDFALRVAKQETGIRCGLVGAAGERGPLQILPSSGRALGYKNVRTASCAVQTDAGMAHLAMCWQEADGNRRAAARCHNGGIGRTWSKNRAVNRYADAVLNASVIRPNK